MNLSEILSLDSFSAENIVWLLKAGEQDKELLFEKAAKVKEIYVGNNVYFRGLIEFSNRCRKNCLYCGIRRENVRVKRYDLTDEEVLDAARFSLENHYGSLVLQSGECEGEGFVKRMEGLLRKIGRLSDHRLRITLSCGEQSYDTYRRWYEAGACRYLLRIESSNPALYEKLHPNDGMHRYKIRLRCLSDLKKAGYQVGTGVMIGLPFQTYDDLANDLLFMQRIDVDMVGMGPYIEHPDTPLYALRNHLLPKEERLQLALKMIAILRLLMKDINIAATTALQAIDPSGRETALSAGANVIMPNITPGNYRDDYLLYENKPCTHQSAEDTSAGILTGITRMGHEIAWDEWGDSAHYKKRDKRPKEGNRKR